MKKEPKYSYNELIEQYYAGNNKAIEELFERISHLVLKWVRESVEDEEEAHDIHQDILMHLWLKLEGGFYHGGYFLGWLRTLSANYLCSYHRKRKLLLQYGVIDNLNIESDTDPVYYETELSKLVTLLSDLSVKQQVLIRMKFWRAMTYKEIAHYTGINHSTVVKRIKVGCCKLKMKMAELGYDEV